MSGVEFDQVYLSFFTFSFSFGIKQIYVTNWVKGQHQHCHHCHAYPPPYSPRHQHQHQRRNDHHHHHLRWELCKTKRGKSERQRSPIWRQGSNTADKKFISRHKHHLRWKTCKHVLSLLIATQYGIRSVHHGICIRLIFQINSNHYKRINRMVRF